MYGPNSVGRPESNTVGGHHITSARISMPFFVILRRAEDPDGPKSDRPTSNDGDFLAVVSVQAGSESEACVGALRRYLADKPSMDIIATATPRL